MTVTTDNRLTSGSLQMPGFPGSAAAGTAAIISWRLIKATK